jgi:signal transduction histidine kinase
VSSISTHVDRAVAIAFAVPTAAILVNESRSTWDLAFAPVLIGLVAAPMGLRRRWPGACVAVATLAAVMLSLVEPRAMLVGLVSVGYTLYAAARSLRLGSALAALGASVLAAAATTLPDLQHSLAATFFALIYVVIWLIGFGVGMDRRHTRAMLASQAELAAAEVERAQAMVTEQRLRMARDLHDVVAHGITSITVQAAYAGLVLADDPAAAQGAVAAIETVGRETLVELRQMLAVLRQDDDDQRDEDDRDSSHHRPRPGLGDLDELITRGRASGLRLSLSVTGTPGPVPAGIQAAVYRTVQEALTNIVKHAQAEEAAVVVQHVVQHVVEHVVDELVVEVTDRGHGCPETIHYGYGLVGMRERALLYGGSFQAGRASDGGFRVVSTFPLRQSSAPSSVPSVGDSVAAL